MEYVPQSQTPIQHGVGIIQDFLAFSFDVKAAGKIDIVDEYRSSQAMWAKEQLRDKGYSEQEIQDMAKNHEDYEECAIYKDYYRFLDQFNRKVLTATAAQL